MIWGRCVLIAFRSCAQPKDGTHPIELGFEDIYSEDEIHLKLFRSALCEPHHGWRSRYIM